MTEQYFLQKTYHPSYGKRRVLIGSDGLPVVLIWIHVLLFGLMLCVLFCFFGLFLSTVFLWYFSVNGCAAIRM